MKAMQYPDGILEEFSIGSGKMPKNQQKILTSTGALLFYGKICGQQFGCVRMIESGRLDENGRKCYYNIAFSENAEKGNKVRDILNYAENHYQEFCSDINSILYYQGADYQVNKEELMNMCRKAQVESHAGNSELEDGFLVPEGRVEDFFLNTQIPVNKDRIRIVTELGEVKKMQTTIVTNKNEKISNEKLNNMNLFFYCSSPSKGFHMKKISAVTGEVLQEGEGAADAMPENAFEITTRSGARMALYKTAYGHCFVAKGIESVKADRYGRYKYANIAFEVPKEQRMMITQLAAWALFDFINFSGAVTDCISVYDGPRGYEVDIEKLQQLLSCFDKKICRIPSKYQASWNKLTDQSIQKTFQFVVIDISLKYFRESTRISVDDEQIAYKISIEKAEQWKKNPLTLEFSEEIYQEEQGCEEKDTIERIQPEREREEREAELAAQEEESEDAMMQEEETEDITAQEEKAEDVMVQEEETEDITAQEEKAEDVMVQEEDVEEIIELEEAEEMAEQEQKDPRGVKDVDYIDLLDKKWFLPAVIGGIVALALFLIFFLKKIM